MVLAKSLSRILYVDDDLSIRELVREALDGQADLSDGVQTLECLRAMELGHHTPVVFVASAPSPHELRRLQAAGAADVIELPFDPAELPRLIRGIWSRISD
jgi:CheY-like chemotaxis protein